MAAPLDHKASIIDGKAIAQTIRNEIAAEVHNLSQKHGKVCNTNKPIWELYEIPDFCSSK
jgi:hypothetical protein